MTKMRPCSPSRDVNRKRTPHDTENPTGRISLRVECLSPMNLNQATTRKYFGSKGLRLERQPAARLKDCPVVGIFKQGKVPKRIIGAASLC